MAGFLVDWVEGVQRTRRRGVFVGEIDAGSDAVVWAESLVFVRLGDGGILVPTAMSSCVQGFGSRVSGRTGGIGDWGLTAMGEGDTSSRLSLLMKVSKLPSRESEVSPSGVALLELPSIMSRLKANRSAMGRGIIGTGGGSGASSGGVWPFFDPLEEPSRNSERFFLSETYPPSEISPASVDFFPENDRKGLGLSGEEMYPPSVSYPLPA